MKPTSFTEIQLIGHGSAYVKIDNGLQNSDIDLEAMPCFKVEGSSLVITATASTLDSLIIIPATFSIRNFFHGRMTVDCGRTVRLLFTHLGSGDVYLHGKAVVTHLLSNSVCNLDASELFSTHCWVRMISSGSVIASVKRTLRLDNVGDGGFRLLHRAEPVNPDTRQKAKTIDE